MNATFEKLKALQNEMNACVVEREDQVEAMLAALLAGVHVLLLGPPGTAKSMLANMLCGAIKGANFFQWLMTKFSTPEEIFGPISMKGLQQDKYTRITTGKLPEAHIAFIDETWKASSAILNTLLTAINERKFHNDGKAVDIPLLTCVGASNELPQGEELGALYDRFLIRFWVDCIQDDGNFINLIDPTSTVGRTQPTTELTLDEIKELQMVVNQVEVTPEILQSVRSIATDLKNAGIQPSDRRWKSALHALRAFALVRGKTAVTEDELELFANMMWDQPQQRRKIQEVVAKYGNPLNLEAVKFLDAANEAFTEWSAKKDQDADDSLAFQTNRVMKEMLAEADKLIAANPQDRTQKLVIAREEISEMRTRVVAALDV